jgi:hypothetical protein
MVIQCVELTVFIACQAGMRLPSRFEGYEAADLPELHLVQNNYEPYLCWRPPGIGKALGGFVDIRTRAKPGLQQSQETI